MTERGRCPVGGNMGNMRNSKRAKAARDRAAKMVADLAGAPRPGVTVPAGPPPGKGWDDDGDEGDEGCRIDDVVRVVVRAVSVWAAYDVAERERRAARLMACLRGGA